jgi:hypothetical protein
MKGSLAKAAYLLFTTCLFLWAACSSGPTFYAVVNTEQLESRDDVRLMDPNDKQYSVKVFQNRDGVKDFLWETNGQIEQQKSCRVKYHGLYSTNLFSVVEGKIGDGKTYPVILDTGTSQAIFVKDIHVLNNNLPIYPLGRKNVGSDGYGIGLCYLPKLRIGEITLTNLPCFYLERRMEFGLFGLSALKDDSIIVGLPAMRIFKYIAFDYVKKEVVFSPNEVFNPPEPNSWEQYTFSIEEDFHGNSFLFVNVPIGGENLELQLDTGNENGLAVTEKLWGKIKEKIGIVNLKKGSELYPYIGKLPCRQGVIGELAMGNTKFENVKVSIFPNDNLLLSESDGMLGAQCFQNTVMVLDFENNLMWVKIPQGR